MPRINVEEEWFSDPRREALKERVGLSVDTVALAMWRIAQRAYRQETLVDPKLFEMMPHWKEFEEVGLAERRGNEVYICGMDEKFSWIRKNKESGRLGGLANASVRLAKLSETKRNLPSSSSSSSSSSSKNKKHFVGSVDPPAFLEIWKIFSGRNGMKGSKKKAYAEWQKLTQEEKDKIGPAIERQKEYYAICKASGAFVSEFPDMWRWLRDKRFNDEIVMPKTPKELFLEELAKDMQ